MVFIFAEYAIKLYPVDLPDHGMIIYAVAAVIALTAINVRGVKPGAWTQNGLTIAKALGLIVIVIVGGLMVTPAAATTTPSSLTGNSNFPLAMVFIMFAFGGWNEMSYVAAELRNPRKNILRAFVLGLPQRRRNPPDSHTTLQTPLYAALTTPRATRMASSKPGPLNVGG